MELFELVEKGMNDVKGKVAKTNNNEGWGYSSGHVLQYVTENTDADAILDVASPTNITSLCASKINKPYICISTGSTQEGKYGNEIYYVADGIDEKKINDIIRGHEIKNPLYLVKMAIGIVLSYNSDDWTGADLNDTIRRNPENGKKVARRMAEIWAKNLTQMNIKQAIMTDRVLEEDTMYGKFGGVTKPLYDYFKLRLKKRGWEVRDYNWDREGHTEKILAAMRKETYKSLKYPLETRRRIQAPVK